MPMPDYIKDPRLNLYARAGFAGIGYSDGAEVEQRMLGVVEAAGDRSVFSPDLAHAITDWPTEYHFSPWRHCLLRPLDIRRGEKVLELGCGCGALTRFLGEIGAVVTAVEGSPMRARIASTRCQDLPNVRVIADELTKLEINETFDWILIVGVLEYAPIFSEAADPARHYLESLSRFLAPEGRLVVAIENKLGLKYFNACGEDHLGIPFVGLQGLYGKRTQRTWGRKELNSLLVASGFTQAKFLYPFPDYKLPRVIFTEAGLSDREFAAEELLVTLHARDYGRNQHRLFDEPLVTRELARNDLIGEMSNSFLVVAARERDKLVNPDVLAVTYAAGRIAAFAGQTSILRGEANIRVIKERFYPDLPCETRFNSLRLSQVVGESSYVAGPMAIWPLIETRARRGGLSEIVVALLPWFEFLLAHAEGSGDQLANYLIGGQAIDLTPFNLIATLDGFTPIDQEWVLDRAVPLGWVMSRSIAILLADYPGFEEESLSIAAVVNALCLSKGLHVSRFEYQSWAELERGYMNAVLGINRCRNIDALKSYRVIPLLNLSADQQLALSSLDTKLAERDAELSDRNNRLSALEIRLENRNHAVDVLEADLADQAAALSALNQEAAALRRSLEEKDVHIDESRQLLSERDARIDELTAAVFENIASKDAAIEASRIRRAEATSEIVALTRLLREKEDDADWLHQVAAALIGDSLRGRLASLMPGPLASMFRNAQLRRRNLFDAAAYLRANPDVARSGGNALRHYIIHGLKERRSRR